MKISCCSNTSMACALPLFLLFIPFAASASFNFEETTIADIQAAFKAGHLNSSQLVRHYLDKIGELNPRLHAVLELNPDALADARDADFHRSFLFRNNSLHGIPVLLKDNIATRDRLNTTAGSFALLGSRAPRDAGVVDRLRHAGAIILGKATMSEWSGFRSLNVPRGWCARGGQGVNPYATAAGPCGSSSGPAIAVASNMVTVALGTETDGSVLCPAAVNSVVAIKPTVGLTSRAGVVPISPRQDTVGPMGRTVADAVAVLDAIVGFDPLDEDATAAAAKLIPVGGYQQFLKVDGLKGKRVGILSGPFFPYPDDSPEAMAFAKHFETMKQRGATLVNNLEESSLRPMLNQLESGEAVAVLAEFKLSLNAYLAELVSSPVRSLADVIDYNNKHPVQERVEEFGQAMLLAAQNTSGMSVKEKRGIRKIAKTSEKGLEKLVLENKLDAVVFPDATAAPVLAVNGYPAISVPAGYRSNGVPFAICFGGLKGSEPKLIEIAYAFEQATKVRRPPLLARRR